ncbi:MAG: hypothetical protein HFI06_05535 [Eubacterium sp.]|jgi:nitrogen-specific signal transduction histidine kinase|nr:hypothetical protein [Eubacterium sp.]NBI86623.1 hypothetical protein [Lachnospiraceae bacterium]
MGEQKNYIFPVEDALEMVLMFGSDGVISYANAAAKKKLEYADDICGRQIRDVFPNADVPGGDTVGQELKKYVAYRKNLTCFPVEAKIVQNSCSPGTYICMAIDTIEKEFLIKEIEQVRNEAQQASKVKSEFVANVTHELRTPVNGIQGNVRELLGEVTDARALKPLRLIERCCGDMNKIINNILDFSKLEAGKFVLEPRKFHFRNMMDYVRNHHMNKLTEKGLGFFVTVSPQIPEYVIGDELRIVQVLNNLLSNAQKFTAVGKITAEAVCTARVGDKIELFFIVKDTGIGIDKTDKDKLFESFSQVDASISRKYGGTGLGLNICRQLVGLMGGKIEVESEKDRGSTFSFSIWVGACEGEEEMPPQTAAETLFFTEGINETPLEEIRKFGTAENIKGLKNNLSKLILSVEMENWEKAEMFMETIRQMTQGAPREVSRAILKLKMAVQKENYDRITAEYAELSRILQA